ncbi:4Fe-4S binding protein [Calditrichota bacterium GD2]
MAQKNRTNYLRLTFQWGIMALLFYMVLRWWIDPNYVPDFEAYCPFGGMQALSSYLVNNSLACSMTEHQIFMGVLLLIGVLIFSKLFCSYICPIGTFTEWLGKIGEKFKVRYTISGVADKALRSLKYILLFLTFYFTVGSSELFCKEYDPFFAVFTGFGSDVVWYFALPALIITILGAVFIRQFWCKYLCPLSAISNIFSNALVFFAVMVIYLILLKLGLQISWLWPAGIIILIAMLLEVARLKGWLFPVFKIKRKGDACVDCNLCNKACPMGLDVMGVETVEHIDCHLCVDCIKACPVSDTLTINKKKMTWLPATATAVLIVLGLFLARTIELPTINMKWGPEQKLETAAIFSQSGLKNIKCYGSAMSFASRMQRVKGVLGVKAYVRSHTAEIYYDPQVIDPEKIKAAIFTPAKTLFRMPASPTDSVAAAVFWVDKLFDTYDSFYFTQLLKQNKGIYGFSTHFGEPVEATIYFNDSLLTIDQIKSIIEQPEVTYVSRGKSYTVKLKFKVAKTSQKIEHITRSAFIKELFIPFNMVFNEYKKYKPQDLAVYKIYMPQALNAGIRRSLMMLVSHLSTNDYIVRFKTDIVDEKPYAFVYFVKNKVPADSIFSALNKPQLTVHYRNGKTGLVNNPFRFPEKGEVIQAEKAKNTLVQKQ